MNALQKLAQGMSGRDAIELAWATCPSKVSVKHPDGASVKASIKAGATGTEIANEIVIAASTIKRGEGLTINRKLPSKRADVIGSQSCELDKLDTKAHAAICSEFAEAFGAEDEAIEQAATKIIARTQAFEAELRKAEAERAAEQHRITEQRIAAIRKRASAANDSQVTEDIEGYITSNRLNEAVAYLDELADLIEV